MKDWANALILCTVISSAIKSLLPRGEKSPLYSALRFLFSLILIWVILSPLFPFLKGEKEIVLPPLPSLPEATVDPDAAKELLLEKSEIGIQEATKLAFPENDFSLYFSSNSERILTGIEVECENQEKGAEICLFLRENFSILATLKQKE